MKIDRYLQLDLLRALADTYPKQISDNVWELLTSGYGEDAVRATALYLDDHGLVRWRTGSAGFTLTITASGLDFLADGGGLSAILGVVTVKLHENTFKSLIEARIQESDIAPADKSQLRDQLRSLPGETIKHLTLKLVDVGLANWPVALHTIQTFARGHGL